MRNERLFKIGINLVRFAWVVEIVAVLIGFLISIIVAYSVYFQLDRVDDTLTFGDYSTILVAGLPFVLVAIVEATKIPVATALMYAKHVRWRIMLFIVLVLLATITFETMINGFERNFSNLTLSIDERKSDDLLLQHKIDLLEERKVKINVISPEKVESSLSKTISIANEQFNEKVAKQNQYIDAQITALSTKDMSDINQEIRKLSAQESKIYDSWEKERIELRQRVRGLVNQNIDGSMSDKQKLSKELDDLKAEMKRELDDSNFLTRPGIEDKYRKLVAKKEERLYAVSDYAVGSKAIQQQTKSEEQLQEHLKVVAKNYQARIDTVRSRIDYLNAKIKNSQKSNEALEKKYRDELENFMQSATQTRKAIVNKAYQNREQTLTTYMKIQAKIKSYDESIYELKEKQREIQFGINRLVNQNQVYRVASYISGKDNAIEVPRETVGIVALVWFGSLAFICAVAGVFLAISGIYIQKIYSGEDESFE